MSEPVRRDLFQAALPGLVLLVGLSAYPALAVPGPSARGAAGLRGTANGRSQGYLGIEFHDASTDGQALNTRAVRGVEIVKVDHDGPAGKAGLQPHDILLSLNGQAIASAEALRRMIHDAGAGVQVALNILRSGRPLTLNAQLATRDEVARAAMARLAASTAPAQPASPSQPASPDLESDASAPDTSVAENGGTSSYPSSTVGPLHGQSFIGSMLHSAPVTGAVLDVMEPQLANFFGATPGTGLLVHSVVPGSAAAQAGLHAGDIVLRVDLFVLRSQADWTKRVHAAKGHPLTLAVLRDRRELTLTLQPEPKRHSLVEWPTLF